MAGIRASELHHDHDHVKELLPTMVAAATRKNAREPHGYTAFSQGLCNCPECKGFGNRYRREQRASRLLVLLANPDHPAHGKRASYDCGCRCSLCKRSRRLARLRSA